MNRELRIFLLAVGIPSFVLAMAGARLVYIQWWQAAHPPPKLTEICPPPDFSQQGCFPPFPRLPHPPEQPPRAFLLFSVQSGMDEARALLIGGCVLGLMFLSLVSGSWLLVRSARRSRLEALRQTDFISNVSHEFKTPLTTICLCAELLQDEALGPERRRKALASIAGESERLKRLVLNALDFSRLEKKRRNYDLREADVAVIARETCAAFLPRFADGRLQAPEGECRASVDADALRQILANLLDNAAKYAPSGRVDVTARREGAGVRLSVADRGPGLKRDDLRHVFDRFWRGDNSMTRETGGSGLGLSIARGLARGMGGDLVAENREGGGAVFTVELGR